MVMNIDGTDRTVLVEGYYIYNPTWSPDGKKIYYGKDSGMDTFIFSINADGTGETQVSPSYSIESRSSNPDDGFPSISPDNTKIAFTSVRWLLGAGPNGATSFGVGGVMIMNIDGSGMKLLETGTWSVDSSGTYSYDFWPEVGGSIEPGVSWSPDGTKIAYSASTVHEMSPQIYVMNADGTGITQLTSDQTLNSRGPSWSPDGTKIVFWRADHSDSDYVDSNQRIYIMNSDGSAQKEVTVNADSGLAEFNLNYPCFLNKPR
jgi:Tol biopolymer transport system component